MSKDFWLVTEMRDTNGWEIAHALYRTRREAEQAFYQKLNDDLGEIRYSTPEEVEMDFGDDFAQDDDEGMAVYSGPYNLILEKIELKS